MPHFADVQAHYDLSGEEGVHGCANSFRTGYIDVNQFTLEK